MIDFDMYCPNSRTENLLQQFTLKLTKEHPHIKVYISTANPYNNWLYELHKKGECQ